MKFPTVECRRKNQDHNDVQVYDLDTVLIPHYTQHEGSIETIESQAEASHVTIGKLLATLVVKGLITLDEARVCANRDRDHIVMNILDSEDGTQDCGGQEPSFIS